MNALTRIYQQNRIREGLPPSPDPLAVEGRPSERDAQAPPVNGAGSATIDVSKGGGHADSAGKAGVGSNATAIGPTPVDGMRLEAENTAHLSAALFRAMCPEADTGPVVVRCSCGRGYSAAELEGCHFRGVQKQLGGYPDIRLYDCRSCKSTFGVEVTK